MFYVWHPYALFFYQLFTEYGRLAMEEIYQKPFQVTIYVKWILSNWMCRKWAQDNLWREISGLKLACSLQGWFSFPVTTFLGKNTMGKCWRGSCFGQVQLCAWVIRHKRSESVKWLADVKEKSFVLPSYSLLFEIWLVFAGGTWFWVEVMWPLRNSVEEGHVAFHLLEALLASALKTSKLLASPDCLLGQRMVWGFFYLVEAKTEISSILKYPL